MREHEMWQIVRRILARMVVPASLGLALAGCGDRAAVPATDGGGGDGIKAAEMLVPEYAAPFPEPREPDLGTAVARYSAPDPAPQPEYAAPFPEPDAG